VSKCVVIIVQARMGSTRLPGKIMKPVLGKPMLSHQLDRLERCQYADEIVIATTTLSHEQPIIELVENRTSTKLFRGSEDNVLSRYYEAAKMFQADVIVRITSDCPLIEPSVVDQCIEMFLENDVDYVSNCHKRTYPRGLDTEVFSFSTLELAHKNATQDFQREHVTPFIWQQPERFKQGDIVDSEDHSDLRWTVDTPEDFELITRIYQALCPVNPTFGYQDILQLLKNHPDWSSLNQNIQQKAL
jgi:spore coat polysaccharide biosynthesis protein SpsF